MVSENVFVLAHLEFEVWVAYYSGLADYHLVSFVVYHLFWLGPLVVLVHLCRYMVPDSVWIFQILF